MKLSERIKAKAKVRRSATCKIFEEEVLCVLHSAAGMSELGNELDKAAEGASFETAKIIAKQFLDPDTNKPCMTASFIDKECSQTDAMELLRIFLRMNGSGSGSLEQAEKN